jgi:AcrR family transcriptional regulator
MEKKSRPSPRGESTRDALLDAATVVFAREGFGPANLREIAEAAAANQALIGYHFHSKEGLYLAVFERMIGQIRLALSPVLAAIDQALAAPEVPCPPEARTDRYLQPLLDLVQGILVHMIYEHPAWGELVLREQQSPGAAYDLLYAGVIDRNHKALVGLLRKLRPQEDLEHVRLLAAAIASQALAIRHYRVPMMRLLQWDAIGDRELDLMKAQNRRNTTLLALGD